MDRPSNVNDRRSFVFERNSHHGSIRNLLADNNTQAAAARGRQSGKSLSMIHKPLNREIKVLPPTTASLLELTGESGGAARKRSSAAYFDDDFVTRKAQTTHTTPTGSLVSVVCGTAANDTDSVPDPSGTTLPEKKEKTVSYLKVDPRKNHISRSQARDLRGGSSKVNVSLSRKERNVPRTHTLSAISPDEDSVSISQVQLTTVNTRNASYTVKPSAPTSALSSPLGLSWITWMLLMVTVGCSVTIMRNSPLFLGMVCGALLMYALLRTYTWLLNPDVVYVYVPSLIDDESSFKDIPLRNLPRNTNESTEESAREFQGWVNLLEGQGYSPGTYHASNTEPVWARLEGMTLKLKKPLESDIPKRAMWNEPVHNVTFVKQIQVDMRSYVVELQPKNLPADKIFGKRFPIILQHKRAMMELDTGNESLFDKYNTIQKKRSPEAIVLFCRTNKEKEEWYRRLDQASRGFPVTLMMLELQRLAQLNQNDDGEEKQTVENSQHYRLHRRSLSDGSHPKDWHEDLFNRDHKQLLIDYMMYMMNAISQSGKVDKTETAKTIVSDPPTAPERGRESRLSPDRASAGSRSLRGKSPDSQSMRKSSPMHLEQTRQVTISDCDTGTLWVNALLQRVFFDFLREQYWRSKIQQKIQRKLNKINLPYYLGPFVISELNLGKTLPLLKRIGQPYMSDDGMWVDCELAYNGGLTMTLETKINLNGLKKEELSTSKIPDVKPERFRENDSDESSTDSEEEKIATPLDKDPKKGEHTVTRFFNRLKESKYFQKLADTRLIKSALDKVSNTPLKLTVELKFLAGLFSMNIAPPPTDRLWLGFRGEPEVCLTAQPVVGQKSVNLAKLSVWIEEKLTSEIIKEFVIPNMMDIRLPVMCGNYKTKPPKPRAKRVRGSASSISICRIQK